jgi:hypothetical protein
MNAMTPESGPATHEQPEGMPDPRHDYQDLTPQKNGVDTLAWYLLVMGFLGILTGGLFFWLYRQGSLRHADYVLNGNALGRYFLIAGITSYMLGRGLTHYRRLRRRRH